MAADGDVTPVFRFLLATGGAAAVVFPTLAAVNGTVLDGQFTSLQVALGSLLVALPVGLEFLFSERDPYVLGRYVGVFVVLFFALGFGQGIAAVLLGRGVVSPAVEFLALLAAYVGAYLLVDRVVVDRLGRDADG